MYHMRVNGREVTADGDKRLLDFLREDLDLTSVKNGCGQGACGACMVLINGRKVRSCLKRVKDVDGCSILTVDGFSEREKQIYVFAFSTAGAVQCGFCTPGMLISTKELLDRNPDPSDDEIREALQGNLCRCTGYLSIFRAVRLAAECLRGERKPEISVPEGHVGERAVRPDAEAKILGTAKFAGDLKAPGMLYGSAVHSQYPRALIKAIHIGKALAHPDCAGIVLAKDIPGERVLGHLTLDWPALVDVGEETRYRGDALALVASRRQESLEEIKGLVEVEYEVRQPVFDPEEALERKDYQVHPEDENPGNVYRVEKVRRGNVDEALASSAYVVTNVYETPFQEHAFLEPESALAVPDGRDHMTVYTGGQSVYDDHREITRLLGIRPEQLRVISAYVGGGFGGKEDMSVQHHAALLAWILREPVRITFTRRESMLYHVKRHPMKMTLTTGCDKDGHLTAMRLRLTANTGAYASLGGPVLQRACTHAAGPYNYQNVDIIGTAVYTNCVPAGAFRGFGVVQSMFATECNLNQLAEKVGIDGWEIRRRNALRPGDVLPNGQIADAGTGIVETLDAVKEAYYSDPEHTGIACAIKNAGVGVGVPDIGRVKLHVEGGRVSLQTSAACMGQGIASTMRAICCEAAGIPASLVTVHEPDTDVTPDSGTSTASRQTTITGEAARLAGLKLKEALQDQSLQELEGQDFFAEYDAVTDPMGCDKPNPVSHVAYGYATQVVLLDDAGRVKKVTAAHDVGRAVNPANVEGQITGGIVMGLGYGLTEDLRMKEGEPTSSYGTMGLWRADDIPEIETILVEKNPDSKAFGAKGVGEIPLIPTSPAVQNALYKRDGIFRTRLPLDHTAYRT